MKIRPIQNERELEVTINARDKFDKAIGDILSQDVPMTPDNRILQETQANVMISLRDELNAVIEAYQSSLKV
jgi:hypothetical protein